MDSYKAKMSNIQKSTTPFQNDFATPIKQLLSEDLKGLDANLSNGWYSGSNSPKSYLGHSDKKNLEQLESTQNTTENLPTEFDHMKEITGFTLEETPKILTRFQRFFVAFNGLMNEMFKSVRTELGVQTLFAPFVICVLITPFAITKIIARATGNDGIINPENS